MFSLLEKLRQKPLRVRKQVAFLAAFGIAGFIFIIWISVIYPDWSDDQDRMKQAKTAVPGPADTFGETVRTGFSEISDQFKELKSTLSAFSIEPTYYSASTTGEEATSTGIAN
jgi:hypothetical protein